MIGGLNFTCICDMSSTRGAERKMRPRKPYLMDIVLIGVTSSVTGCFTLRRPLQPIQAAQTPRLYGTSNGVVFSCRMIDSWPVNTYPRQSQWSYHHANSLTPCLTQTALFANKLFCACSDMVHLTNSMSLSSCPF